MFELSASDVVMKCAGKVMVTFKKWSVIVYRLANCEAFCSANLNCGWLL